MPFLFFLLELLVFYLMLLIVFLTLGKTLEALVGVIVGVRDGDNPGVGLIEDVGVIVGLNVGVAVVVWLVGRCLVS